jgi:ribonuclease HI
MILDKDQLVKVLSLFPDSAEIEIYDNYTKKSLPIGTLNLDLVKKDKIVICVSSVPVLERVVENPEDPVAEYAIYVDGSCDMNNNVGGFGYVVVHCATGKVVVEGSDGWGNGTVRITNQRMELVAAIHGLQRAKANGILHNIRVVSDSEYLVKTMRGDYRIGSNRDLWDTLNKLVDNVSVDWVHHSENEIHWLKHCHDKAYHEMTILRKRLVLD